MKAAIHYYEAAHFVGLRIDSGRLEFVDVIGHGAEGEVLLARNVCSDPEDTALYPEEYYAVKVISKLGLDPKAVIGLQDEISLQQRASSDSHPNIIKLHNVVDSIASLFLVSTFCSCGDLFEQIVTASTSNSSLSNDHTVIRSIILQLIDVVNYLHEEKNIAHRDIKPENLYWDAEEGKLLIGDFGLASEGRYASDFGNGTSFYASPEAVGYFRNLGRGRKGNDDEDDSRKYRYDAFESDVWSIGIVIINLICERNPWQYAMTSDEAFVSYLNETETFLKEILPDITEDCHTLLKSILKVNPEERITLPELREAIREIEAFTIMGGGGSREGEKMGAERGSWIDMDSRDSGNSRVWFASGCVVGSGSPSASPDARQLSDGFYTTSPETTFSPEYRFPPASAPLVYSSSNTSSLSKSPTPTSSTPSSVPCSLSLSASTAGTSEAALRTPLSEIGDPMRSLQIVTKSPLLLPIAEISLSSVKEKSHGNKWQQQQPAITAAAGQYLPLRTPVTPSFQFSSSSNSASPVTTFYSPIPGSLPSPSGLRTPVTPNFQFSTSPMMMHSPLRHAQQSFLEKHYAHYGNAQGGGIAYSGSRRGSLPLAYEKGTIPPSGGKRRGSRPVH